MFDRSHLPPCQIEFAVIADTHYMLDNSQGATEFSSRQRQTARAERALARVAALNVPFVVHMGDLVQEFPERPRFREAVAGAQAQLRRHGLDPIVVAGNHDIGDKPDPTMPAAWVTADFLADHHRRFGPSWRSWEAGPLHCMVLNSQILNSDLPAAAEQAAWFEADLAVHRGRRMALFLHLPPFLHDTEEESLGHYDNIDQPARRWLLAQIEAYSIEIVFSAHVHFAFYNRLGPTEFYTVPSVSFTRPGFGEPFASAAAADQGRDDAAKLGFYLVRVHEDGCRVHLIRTEPLPGTAEGESYCLTRLARDLPGSPLGVVLHHPLTNTAQTPSVWPSSIRQPVHNDYPYLALQELGVRHLLLPASDLLDPGQTERIASIRQEGVSIAVSLLLAQTPLSADRLDALAQHADTADTLLIHLAGRYRPTASTLTALRDIHSATRLPLTLSCIVPGRDMPGKQHPRSQIGYRPEWLAELAVDLAGKDHGVARVLCRLEGETLPEHGSAAAAAIGGIDWITGIRGDDDGEAERLIAALRWVAGQPNSRLYLEPFVDLDRTMDRGVGLLDRLCNPRAIFHRLRIEVTRLATA